MQLFLTFYSSNNPEKRSHAPKLFPTLIINMISEGSCVTEDWSNDAENSALITEINYILQYIHIEHSCFELL